MTNWMELKNAVSFIFFDNVLEATETGRMSIEQQIIYGRHTTKIVFFKSLFQKG